MFYRWEDQLGHENAVWTKKNMYPNDHHTKSTDALYCHLISLLSFFPWILSIWMKGEIWSEGG